MADMTAKKEVRGFLAARLRDTIAGGDLVEAVDSQHLYGSQRSLQPAEIAEVARATERVAELVVSALTDSKSVLAPPAERYLRRLGGRRAQQGISLDAVTTAFRRAARIGLSAMKEAAAEWPDSWLYAMKHGGASA